MEELKKYLNSLSTVEQSDFAKKCGTSIGYLRKGISVETRFDGSLCRKLNKHSNWRVSLDSLRPDVFNGLFEIKDKQST